MILSKINSFRQLLFWWLIVVATMHVLGGIALAFEFPEAVWQVYRQDLYLVFSVSNEISDQVDTMISMILRLFGPTVASWGCLMIYLLHRIFSHNDRAALVFLSAATILWFLLDTTISLTFGVTSHLYINSAAFIAIILPLAVLRFKDGY